MADILPFGQPKDYPEFPRSQRGLARLRPSPDTGARKSGIAHLPLYRMTPVDYERVDCFVELHRRNAERRAELDADLSIIGWGLAAGYLFVVVFRLAQLVVLS